MEKKIKRVTKVYVITPMYIVYTEPLTDEEYKVEIVGIKEEIEDGATQWAYSAKLRKGKVRVVESLVNLLK
jgi:hypothetical protein